MPDPVLLAVEADSATLEDVERELRDRYGRGYDVVGTLSPDEALATLEENVIHVLRLDEPDPIAAWRERIDTLVGAAERLALPWNRPAGRPRTRR
jgi:hypothetical protein